MSILQDILAELPNALNSLFDNCNSSITNAAKQIKIFSTTSLSHSSEHRPSLTSMSPHHTSDNDDGNVENAGAVFRPAHPDDKITTMTQSLQLIETNIARIKSLIESCRIVVPITEETELKTEVMLSDILAEIKNEYQLRLDNNDIALDYSIAQQLNQDPCEIKTESFKLIIKLMVNNCIDHAFIDHTKPAQISVLLKGDEDNLYVIVEDNGIGISAELSERIFTPFYSTGNSLKNTGLGLSIVSTLVTYVLKGNIKLEGASRFVICMPLPEFHQMDDILF